MVDMVGGGFLMAYDTAELRTDILDLFEDTERLSRYKADRGELPYKSGVLYIRPISDEELLEEARNAKPLPRVHPPISEGRALRRRVALRARGRWLPKSRPLVTKTPVSTGYWRGRECPHCGARSAVHRCPNYPSQGAST